MHNSLYVSTTIDLMAAGELPPKLLYSRRDAAHALSISQRSLDYLIKTKRLKVRYLGKKPMVSFEELERFASRDHRELTGNASRLN
ncbi:MAG: hypothetical protein JSS95_03810 [Acidobacteria bacterium]|nr:hypothetical protein [Acidobacteriota bacterium]